MFPRHARRIMLDMKIKVLFDLLTKLYDMGYKNVTMVVGADRINEFDILIKKNIMPRKASMVSITLETSM